MLSLLQAGLVQAQGQAPTNAPPSPPKETKAKQTQAPSDPAVEAMNKAYKAKNYPEALKLLDKIIATNPDAKYKHLFMHFQLLLLTKQYDTALRYGKDVEKNVYNTNPSDLNVLAWMVVDPDNPVDATPALNTWAVQVAKKAVDAQGKNPVVQAAYQDTLAAALYLTGDVRGALATQKAAVAALKENHRSVDPEMLTRLAKYQRKEGVTKQ